MLRTLACVLLMLPLTGCLAGAAVGLAVDATGAVVGAAVKTTGAAVDLVVPGDDEDEEDEDNDDN